MLGDGRPTRAGTRRPGYTSARREPNEPIHLVGVIYAAICARPTLKMTLAQPKPSCREYMTTESEQVAFVGDDRAGLYKAIAREMYAHARPGSKPPPAPAR